MLSKEIKDMITDRFIDDIRGYKIRVKELEREYNITIKEVTNYTVGLRRCFLLKENK